MPKPRAKGNQTKENQIFKNSYIVCMITVKAVKTKKDLGTFIKFPFSIYQDCPYWVPPIISQEKEVFNTTKNPVFKDAEAHLFIAYKNEKPVGRIAGIVNYIEINQLNQPKMRFGWFDFIDDMKVSKALLSKIEAIGREKGLAYCEGPVGFSNLDKVGIITEGFEFLGPMVTWYNYPYYLNHYQKHGYTKEKGYAENHFSFSNVNPELFVKARTLIERRYSLTAMNFKSTKELLPYVDDLFELFNTTYSELSSFVKITPIQIDYIKRKFIPFINPEYVKFVLDKNKKIIAFSIVMPFLSAAVKQINGKLFPLGLVKLLKAKKHSKTVEFTLIGILPEYQNKGVTAIIFDEYYKTFTEKGIEQCIRTPELEDNLAIHQLWKHFDPILYRKRQTMRKYL